MPPTICSGTKRQTRVDMRNNSRRSLQNSDLNHDTNMQTTEALHFNELGHLHKIVGGGLNSNYQQLVVDMSDNAVTSTTHLGGSQTETDSLDGECRLINRDATVSNDSSYYTNTNSNPNRDSSSLSSSSSSSASSLLEGKTNNNTSLLCLPSDVDGDESEMFDDSYNNTIDESHKSNDSLEIDCESVSMTSLDTEKSAKLKRGNQPLLRDKLMAKTHHHHHKGLKCVATNIRNTEGLLSIAIKTIKLVKRNQLLQQRLTQLQMETSEFIQSVLANPENSHFRTKIPQQQKARELGGNA